MKRVIGAALAALLSAALLIGPGAAMASTTTLTPAPTPAAAQISDDGVAPIAVLLDTSGSMNEDDGAGTLKLRGAKNAVRDIVRNLSSTTVFGLRTYPASGGCDEGLYVHQPAPLTRPDAVLSSVEGITADGSTPTGEALRALADDLTARGYTTATIVLVSDGESTCSAPPCDVAKQLVQEGFDVTVPTIGFRTSAAGSEELACVAEATGGVYLDAGDSAELAEQLDSLVRAQLELTVRYDPTPMPGASTTITAVITHKGGEAATDVRVALTLADANNPDVRRAAIPPMTRVGNIPAGTSIERSWTVGTGPRDDPERTLFTVSAWGTNVVRVASEGDYMPTAPDYSKEALGALFSGVGDDTPLVIFGDSYSSGEGIGSGYYQTPEGVSFSCHRNQKTYLGTIFPAKELVILACSGAESDDIFKPSIRSTISQIQEMNSYGTVPGAAVLTFGGNDIHFVDVVKACISPFSSCGDPLYRNLKIRDAGGIGVKLEDTYKRAWSALNTPDMRQKRGGDYVPLIVLPYPLVTHEMFRGGCHQFDPAEVVTADQVGKTLNDTIRRAVDTVRSEGYEVYFVPDVQEAVRPDHTLCETGDQAFINGWIPWDANLAKVESVHPKESGYLAETDVIIRWSRTVERIQPDVSDAAIADDLRAVAGPVEITWPTGADLDHMTGGLSLTRGGAVAPTGSGFQPGTPVSVNLHSDPVFLGSLLADEQGRIAGVIDIPVDAALGQHELVFSGLDENSEYFETRIPASIVFPTPWWVWGILALGVVSLLAAAALVLIGLGRRRQTTVTASR